MPAHIFTIDIASVPDRDELVAELWFGEQQVAELAQEGGRLLLQLYKPPSGKYWEFDYAPFAEALAAMRARLLEE